MKKSNRDILKKLLKTVLSWSEDRYSRIGHIHDNRYYTESEMDTKLSGKSSTGHTHSQYAYKYSSTGGDFNNYTSIGFYQVNKPVANTPKGGTTTNYSILILGMYNGITQIAVEENTENMWIRTRISGTWGAWKVPLKNDYSLLSHLHDDRYYTETEVNSLLAGKSSTSHIHDSRYYTESEMDTKLAGKSNTGHTHNYASSSHTHDDRYYTESEMTTLLSGKSNTTHNHDSTYRKITDSYTKNEVNTLLAGKANSNHTHSQYATSSHTHSNYASTSHTHDSRYYTESEMNTKLSGKSDTNHTHSQYATSSHTHSNYASTSHTHSNYVTSSSMNSELDKKSGDILFDGFVEAFFHINVPCYAQPYTLTLPEIPIDVHSKTGPAGKIARITEQITLKVDGIFLNSNTSNQSESGPISYLITLVMSNLKWGDICCGICGMGTLDCIYFESLYGGLIDNGYLDKNDFRLSVKTTSLHTSSGGSPYVAVKRVSFRPNNYGSKATIGINLNGSVNTAITRVTRL